MRVGGLFALMILSVFPGAGLAHAQENPCNRLLSGDVAPLIRDLAKLRLDLDQRRAAGLGDAVTRALEAEYLKKEAQIFSLGVSLERLKEEILKAQIVDQEKIEEQARLREEAESQAESLETSLKRVGQIAPRVDFAQSMLPDGRLVISGGRSNSYEVQPYSTVEWIDLATGETGVFADLQVGRWDHVQSTLPDGRILFSGGWGQPEGFLSSTETLDVQTGTILTDELSRARSHHAQSVSFDGQAIVSGGTNFEGTQISVEQGGKVVANLLEARSRHIQTLLPDGTLLVAGGKDYYGSPVASMEIVDLKKGTSEKVGDLPVLGAHSIQVFLSDGRVLFAVNRDHDAILALFDPSDRSMQKLPETPHERIEAATAMSGGQVALTTDSGSVYLLKVGRK